MQHTDKYKLDLIEKEDAFSPDALNANTQKVEEALIAHEGAVKEVTDGLDQRVTVLEATKLVAGVFKSTNIPNDIIELGFTPEAVILSDAHGANQVCFITKAGSYVGNGNVVVVENGFQLVNGGGSTAVNNGRPICFFAFG